MDHKFLLRSYVYFVCVGVQSMININNIVAAASPVIGVFRQRCHLLPSIFPHCGVLQQLRILHYIITDNGSKWL